ncbi:hypothetical protein CSAL01_01665 [Colletotrichum salicis]|uniref:Uncharacterized protein n=1 Tax=Colletotrichum salicis TaxID=1209931 RepID=A0A135S0K4_9PEZI|nr:hypothetical protein CSAL01_01665 [Colletotrichum salicis]
MPGPPIATALSPRQRKITNPARPAARRALLAHTAMRKGGQRNRAMSTWPDLHRSTTLGTEQRERATGYRATGPRTRARHSAMPWSIGGVDDKRRRAGLESPRAPLVLESVSHPPPSTFPLPWCWPPPKFHGAPKPNRRLQGHASLPVPDQDHRAAHFQRKIGPPPKFVSRRHRRGRALSLDTSLVPLNTSLTARPLLIEIKKTQQQKCNLHPFSLDGASNLAGTTPYTLCYTEAMRCSKTQQARHDMS